MCSYIPVPRDLSKCGRCSLKSKQCGSASRPLLWALTKTCSWLAYTFPQPPLPSSRSTAYSHMAALKSAAVMASELGSVMIGGDSNAKLAAVASWLRQHFSRGTFFFLLKVAWM